MIRSSKSFFARKHFRFADKSFYCGARSKVQKNRKEAKSNEEGEIWIGKGLRLWAPLMWSLSTIFSRYRGSSWKESFQKSVFGPISGIVFYSKGTILRRFGILDLGNEFFLLPLHSSLGGFLVRAPLHYIRSSRYVIGRGISLPKSPLEAQKLIV